MNVYQRLSADLGLPDSKLIPRLFALLADEDEAKVMMAASTPQTAEEIAAATGFEQERIDSMLAVLFQKGLIFKSRKPDAIRYYKGRNFVQFHDATVLTPGVSPEYLDLWKQFRETEQIDLMEMIKGLDIPRIHRVVPVNVSLEPQNQILAYDDVARMVEGSDKIAVANCPCRLVHPVDDLPLEVCMQMNKGADYHLERGSGRELTKAEALGLLKMCEEMGLVHCVENKYGQGNIICNCDRDACIGWGHDRAWAKSFTAPSRFRAEVQADLCTVCELCIERCFFDAVAMVGVDNTAAIDPDKCMGCGICVPTCPGEAIVYREVTPLPEH